MSPVFLRDQLPAIRSIRCLLPALRSKQRIIWNGSSAPTVQILFPKQLLIVHKKPSLPFKTSSHSIAHFLTIVIRIFPFRGNYSRLILKSFCGRVLLIIYHKDAFGMHLKDRQSRNSTLKGVNITSQNFGVHSLFSAVK